MSVKKNLIDQKEYLKKYISGDKKKKKKDKKHKKHERRLKIIDDNLFAHEANDIDEELLITGEDAPQIVGEVIELESDVTKATKWRNIAIKDEPTDNNEESKYKPDTVDLWGGKKEDKKIKDEYSPKYRKIKKEPVDEIKAVDSDLSPPRHRHRIDSDSDLCLRRRERSEDSDMSLPRRRQTANIDKSMSKRSRKRSNDSDLSLPRRNRRESYDSDMSLKRRRRPDRNNTDSSPRRRRAGSDRNDNSPRWSRKRRNSDDSDLSLPRRRRRGDSHSRQIRDHSRNEKRTKIRSIQNPEFIHSDNDSDLDFQIRVKVKREIISPGNNTLNKSSRSSPVRVKQEKLTPPRKKQSRWNKPEDDARSSPIKTRFERKPSSPAPTHRRNERKSSTPPPTHRGKDIQRQKSSPIRNRHKRKSSSPPPTHKGKTLDGKKSGLQDAQSLKLENEKRRGEEEKLFEEMSKDVSGRDAEIAVRKSGRKGRRGREAAEENPEEREQREHREKEKKEVYDRWGKGVKQVEDYRQRLEEDAYEASKPLARYSNDEDLDRYLREQEHAEDPMLQYMREKKRLKAKEENVPIIPKYEGSFPENRLGIRPGYRWDGVDRSNGYEKRWFEVRNEKRAREEEAYKYSVEDM